MIAFQTFLQKIQKGLKEYYGEAYKVEIHEVKKNNAVICHGITIMHAESNAAPTIYMEQLYQEYMDGSPLSEIFQKVVKLYEKYKIEEAVDMNGFLDFEKAGKRIAYKLIHYENNQEELKEVPHIRFLDMAIVFYYEINHAAFGNATILIRRNICNMWGVDEKELYRLSGENTPRMLPPLIRDMREILEAAGVNDEYADGEGFMYVLTNFKGQFGAACLLYPHLLECIAQKFGGNFYLLPSSVHEVILVPQREGMRSEAFWEIVREVNHTQVEREEVLSDSVYYYDCQKKELIISYKV